MKKEQKKFINRARMLILPLTLFVTMSLTSCGTAAQPAVKINVPPETAAGDVEITVDVQNFALNEGGRIIYYMDASVPTYYDHSAVSKAGTYAVSNETSHLWSNVTPGAHKFSAQLVDNKNSPLPSPVVDTVMITVGPPKGTPAVGITDPADGASLPAGNILISADVQSFIVSRADMGAVNRDGEGHFIYYIDEAPPVEPGVPATTATAIVSTSMTHLWKTVTAGKHTFSVQLVNNDDTPLTTPVTATITLDVTAE